MQCLLVHEVLSNQARQQADGPALYWQGAATSYRSLETRVQQLATRLVASTGPGARIAVLAWNCPEFIELIYAVSASGRILVPLNARLAPAELIWQLQAASVSVLFAEQELLVELSGHTQFPAEIETISLQKDYPQWLHSGPEAALPDIAEQDTAWILYTSGSTGRPKGSMLSHKSFMAGLRSAALGRPVLPGDHYLYPFPLFHVAAHNVLLQHQHGAAVVLLKSFEAGAVLEACRHLNITTMSLAPTMIAMLLDHPDFAPADLATVRTIGYGASAMPQTLLQRLQSLCDVGLCQSYGMTELAGSVAFLTVEDHRRAAREQPQLLRSVGRPLATASIRLEGCAGKPATADQCGEILVKAEQCMSGYWQDTVASAEAIRDGWLHTGDIGQFDEQGYLYIVDRKKDMILSGGENVASREVEEVIRSHPNVKDCSVIGIADSKWGEAVCAVVQLLADTDDDSLDSYCREHLAGYKTPKSWVRLDVLPVNAGGKVDKPRLRHMVGEQD
jgi:acyl-CoA synthetase (AMP-forming)/AMP-acid ligase II